MVFGFNVILFKDILLSVLLWEIFTWEVHYPRGMEGHHLLQSSYVGEGGGGASAGETPIFRLAPPAVTREDTVGAGL